MDLSGLTILATKPQQRPAVLLAEMGASVQRLEEDEGTCDRYILSEQVAVERRTGNTFLRGIIDKSLFTSAIYLREHFESAALIVEGEVDYTHSHFDPQAVRGALSAMLLEYGTSVISTTDAEETTHLIAMMARHAQLGVPDISLVPKRKAAELADLQRRVVEMLPGCGMVLARDLLQHFGSIERIVAASREEFEGVPGVGKQKTDAIYRVLHAQYEAVDTEKHLEDAIQAHPELLFEDPVDLLARQHHIYADAQERHVVDLVFRSAEGNELILTELKRGKLTHEHVEQLRRYLDHAHESDMLALLLAKGATLRGVLATVETCTLEVRDTDIRVCIVDRDKTIDVLKQLRAKRLENTDSAPGIQRKEKE